jgi:hypothetical protein
MDGESIIRRHHPVVTKTDWLPEGLWPELDECRTVHEAAVARVEQATKDSRALGKKFEAEDEARIDAYKTGHKAPKMTDPAEREREVAETRAKHDAAEAALAEAVANAVDTIESKGREWLDDLAERLVEADEKRAEAKRLLAEADKASREIARLQMWVGRSSGEMPRAARLGHTRLSDLPIPEPSMSAEDQLAALTQVGEVSHV